MLCKKCNTGVFEKDKACAACGAPINRLRNLKIAAQVFVLLLFVGICAAYLMRARLSPKNVVTDPVAALITPTPAASEIPANVTEPPLEVVPTSDLKKDIGDVWKMLRDVRGAAKTYIANRQNISFTSRGGYLYDYLSKSYVTMDVLNRRGLIESRYRTENVMILYVRPSDLEDFPELNFGKSEELDVYTAYETIEGIALMSSQNYGILYREHFAPLLEKYSADHGKPSRPQIASIEYADVIQAIQSHNFEERAYDVRYLSIDSKYAYVVYSVKDNPNILHNCVLQWDDGWHVMINDASVGETAFPDINRAMPDFNESLMPNCNMDLLTLAPTEYFDGLIDTLLKKETFAQSELPVTYMCGTYDAVYFELSSGGKYVAVYYGDSWIETRVSQFIEAEDILKATFRSNPPVLIVKQE